MKFGQCAHTFGRKSMEEVLNEIAEVGFQGVEFFAGAIERYNDKPGEFKSILLRRGLELSSLYCGGITPKVDEKTINRIIEAAAFLSKLQVPVITIGPGPRKREGNSKEDYEIMSEALNDLGKRCMEMGVYACFHPHYGASIETREEIDEIFNLSDPDYVYFCPDTGHLAKGRCNVVEVVETYVDRIKYVHLKDYNPNLEWGEWGGQYVELGTGTIDHARIFDILKAAGYDGWLVVEVPGSSSRGLTPKESSRISLEYLKRQE